MPFFSTLTACLFLAVHAGGLVSAAPAPVLSTVDAAVPGAHAERANVVPIGTGPAGHPGRRDGTPKKDKRGRDRRALGGDGALPEVDGSGTPPFSPKPRQADHVGCGDECDPGGQDRRVKARQPPKQKMELKKKGCDDDACDPGGQSRRVKARQPPKQQRAINDDPTGPSHKRNDDKSGRVLDRAGPFPRKIEENSAARAGPNQRAVEVRQPASRDASFRPEQRNEGPCPQCDPSDPERRDINDDKSGPNQRDLVGELSATSPLDLQVDDDLFTRRRAPGGRTESRQQPPKSVPAPGAPPRQRDINEDPSGPNQRAVEAPDATRKRDDAFTTSDPEGGLNFGRRRAPGGRTESKREHQLEFGGEGGPVPGPPPKQRDINDDMSGASGAWPIRRAEEGPEDFFTPPPDPNAPPANDVGDGSRVRAVEAPAGASRKRVDAAVDSDDAGPL